MMLSSNLNGSFQQANQFQQQKNQAQPFPQSLESNCGSIGASSLLTAANTLIFNSPASSSSSLTGSYIKSPFVSNSKPVSQSPKLKSSSGNFSSQLLKLQNSNQDSNLDFDLHYNLPFSQQQHINPPIKANGDEAKISKLDEINFNLTALNRQTQQQRNASTKFDDYLFKDDDDPIEFDDEDDKIDEGSNNTASDFEKEDESLSISSVFSFKRLPNQNSENLKPESNAPESIIGRVLNNPIAYNNQTNRMIQNQAKLVSMNVPIETKLSECINDNTVGSIKKVNFLNETSPNNSYVSASITPTSHYHFNDSTPQNSVPSNKSRTLMKLQLMKQQAEQSEKKAAAASLSSNITGNMMAINQNHTMGSITFNKKRNSIIEISTETILPSSLTSSEIIPRNSLPQVFQSETKLEYPTKYHVMQIAKSLQQSVSSSSVNNSNNNTNSGIIKQPRASSNNNSFKETTNSLASSGDIAILPNSSSYYSDCAFNEKFSQHSVDSNDLNQMSSPTSSSFSQADYIDEIDDLVHNELNSNKRSMSTNLTNLEIQEEINRIEECLNLPKTLPSDYLKLMSPLSSQPVRASTSCPADIVRIKRLKGINLTEDEIKLIVKDRQKKDNHNMIERRRRFNINDRIKELGSILPKPNQGETKQNKGSILKASVDYIKNLQYEVSKIKELGEQFNQMTLLNRKLVNRIKELEREKHQKNYNTIKESDEMNQTTKSLNIKQEPFLSKSHNLVSHMQTQSSTYFLSTSQQPSHDQFCKTSQQHSNSILNLDHLLINNDTSGSDLNLLSTQNDFSIAQDSDVLFNESMLDEILNSALKNQESNQNLLSNMYNNMMDSLDT